MIEQPATRLRKQPGTLLFGINEAALERLPVAQIIDDRITKTTGPSSVFLEPPGFPDSYICTWYPTPNSNSHSFIVDRQGVPHLVSREHEKLMALWEPLPFEHELVQKWVKAVFAHMAFCYQDPKPEVPGETKISWPLDDHFWLISTGKVFLHDDLRFKDEWRNAKLDQLEKVKEAFVAKWRAIATPENHSASITIRRYYPNVEIPREWCAEIDGPVYEGIPATTGKYIRDGQGQWKLLPKEEPEKTDASRPD